MFDEDRFFDDFDEDEETDDTPDNDELQSVSSETLCY
jgi:hypothetical protein